MNINTFILGFKVFKCRFIIATNVKVLWLVGTLELVRPNVRRYKLLILSYLQMFGSFRLPKQKNSQCSITSVSPHLPQYYVGGSRFCPSDDVSMSKSPSDVS
jgi:hypothetical protein